MVILNTSSLPGLVKSKLSSVPSLLQKYRGVRQPWRWPSAPSLTFGANDLCHTWCVCVFPFCFKRSLSWGRHAPVPLNLVSRRWLERLLGMGANPSLTSVVTEASAQPQSDSAQFSHSVMSESLWPHGLQHPRPACPSPTPRAYSDSRPWREKGMATTSVFLPWEPREGMIRHSASIPVNGALRREGPNSRGGGLGLEAPSPPCPLPAPPKAHPQGALFFIPGYLPWKYYKTLSYFPS